LSPSLRDDLQLALRLAGRAAEISLGRRDSRVAVALKPDGSPVTDVDREIERELTESLQEARPADAILGEESQARGEAERVWIIDPIDGTSHYLAGRSDWGNHVALEVRGEVVLGVLTRPDSGELWFASLGGGAYRASLSADQRRRVTIPGETQSSTVGVWEATDGPVAAALGSHRRLPTTDLNDILRVVLGDLDALVDVAGAPWDHAPFAILVEEAGGQYSDIEGNRTVRGGTVVYSNGAGHDELCRIVGAALTN